MTILEKISEGLNKLFICIAGLFLLLMMLLTCANIAFRLSGKPISGTVELLGFLGAITATFALGYTQTKRDHISVTVLSELFPKPLRKITEITNDVVCMLFSLLAGFQIFRIAKMTAATGEITETLGIIYYPFVYAASAGFFMLVLIFLVELIKVAIGKAKEPDVYEKEFEAEE